MEVDGGALDLDAANGGVRHRALDEQVLRLAVVLLVPATLPFELEGEGGVLVLEDPAHRVHHVEEAEGRHRRNASGAPQLEPTLRVAPAALALRDDHDGRGLGAQHPWAEGERDEAVRARERHFLLREAALGTDQRDRCIAVRWELIQPASGFLLPRDQAQPGPRGRDDRGQRRRGIDHGNAGAAGLLGGGHRDPPPAVDMRRAADHALRRHGCDPVDTQLGRLLDDEVHLRALEQRRRQRQLERRLAHRPGAGDDVPDRLARTDAVEDHVVLAARVVEHAQPIAGLEPQGSQVAQLGTRDVHARFASAHPGEVKAQHQRSSRSVRQGPAARVAVTRSAAKACATAAAWTSSTPETMSRPRGATAAVSAPASATSASARRFAITRSNRARSAATRPTSSATSGTPLRARFARARGRAEASTSSATTRATPSRASAAASTPEPVPTSSAETTGAPPTPPTASSISSRHVRVVSCCPVPNAIPGSITRTSRPGASGTSHGGATRSRSTIASGRWWRRNTASQSRGGRVSAVIRTRPAAGSI